MDGINILKMARYL